MDYRLEWKRRAVNYYNSNQIPQKIEKLLNLMLLEDPHDIHGYVSEYFSNLSKPATFAQIAFRDVLSPSGFFNREAGVKCCINGVIKPVVSLQTLSDDRPQQDPKSIKPAKSNKDTKNKANKKDLTSRQPTPAAELETVFSYSNCCYLIEEYFTPALLNAPVHEQVDAKLKTASESYEIPTSEIPTSTPLPSEDETSKSLTIAPSDVSPPSDIVLELNLASFFTSLIAKVASAKIKNEPLYMSSLNDQVSMPLPAFSLFSCNPASPGKLNLFRDVMLVPTPATSYNHAVTNLLLFYKHLETLLVTKFGADIVLRRQSSGAFKPSFDRIEQVFDFIRSAVHSYNQPEVEFQLAIHVASDEIYDENKMKYEVSNGVFKSSEELVAMFKDWCANHDVIALIDGLSVKDSSSCEMLSQIHGCYLFTSHFDEDVLKQLNADGVLCQPEKSCATITEFNDRVDAIKGLGGILMMTDNWCAVQDSSVIVDLAISVDCLFLRVSPYMHSNRSINRLLVCHSEAESLECLVERENHVFSQASDVMVTTTETS